MARKMLLFVINHPEFFLSHRLSLAISAQNEGFNVHVATMGERSAIEKIEKLGFVHHRLLLSRSGQNPLREFISFIAMLRLFRQTRPDLIHLVTIKPVIYGGIAARMVNVPGVVSAISGLGFLFVKRDGLLANLRCNIVLYLYRIAMRHPNQRVIFQNPTDMNTLIVTGGVKKDKARMIRGSGVDLQIYQIQPERAGVPVVMMISRLLKDKGVCEFVEAARLINAKGIKVHFQLVGAPDLGNPGSITADLVEAWEKEGIIECLGFRSDIVQLLSQAHIVVLPSYYGEGLPKVLIEAAACARAVITTNMPGCRDAIESNVTGLLVPARDVHALVQAMERLIEDKDLRLKMGLAGRDLAVREFGIDKVVSTHMAIYDELLDSSGV